PYQMVDVRVTLYDGKYHTVDSWDMAFQIAGSLAIKEAAAEAGVALLEPIMEVEIVVPESYMGEVIGDLNSKRGKVLGMETTGSGKQRIRAMVPQSEMTHYAIDLRSMHGRRGRCSSTGDTWQEVARRLGDKTSAAAQKAKQEARSA